MSVVASDKHGNKSHGQCTQNIMPSKSDGDAPSTATAASDQSNAIKRVIPEKGKVSAKFPLSVTDQTLCFKDAALPNDSIISDCGIVQGSDIHLLHTILVKTKDDDTIALRVEFDYKVHRVLAMLNTKGIDTDGFHLIFESCACACHKRTHWRTTTFRTSPCCT